MACSPRKSNFKFDVPKPKCFNEALYVKEKRLLGAGPSNLSDEVLEAVGRPMMGHLHPETLKVSNIFF